MLAFENGTDAGLLIVAPAPSVAQKRWCRWTPSPRLGVGSPDDLERLSLATMRVGYALGMADSWAGRDSDVIGRDWMERTLPKMMQPAGIVVTSVVPLGWLSEVEIAGDRMLLWDRCAEARIDAGTLHHEALLQLEAALNEMGGVAMHDFDYFAADDAADLPTGELRGTQQLAAGQRRGNAA